MHHRRKELMGAVDLGTSLPSLLWASFHAVLETSRDERFGLWMLD